MKSNWEQAKQRSQYHFDPQRRDQAHEVIEHLGRVDPGHWQNDIDEIVANSKPATWATRGYKGEGVQPPREDLVAENTLNGPTSSAEQHGAPEQMMQSAMSHPRPSTACL